LICFVSVLAVAPFARAYLPAAQTAPMRHLVARLRNEAGPPVERPRPLRPAPEPEQLALTLD